VIKILHSEAFQPLGKPIPRPAAPAPEPVQIKPGIWKNPDGRLETRNPAADLIVNGGYGGKPAPKTTPAAIGVDLAAGSDRTCITVWELSRELGVKGSEVIIACMRYGQQVTLNQAIDDGLADLVRKELAETPLPVLPSALDDGWIEWGGGECPVEPGTAIEVRMRVRDHCAMRMVRDFTSRSAYDFWLHQDMGNDIVAYRLLPQEAA